jgi:uncharacterized protein
MLRIDLRDLDRGPVETDADLPPDHAAFADLGFALEGPLAVRGRMQATGAQEYYWRGRVHGLTVGQCRRCLAEVRIPIEAEVNLMFSGDPDAEDDPSVYPLPPRATHIDLTQAVREELALSVPGYPLCREECAGLCPRCGADLNAGQCGCAVPANV